MRIKLIHLYSAILPLLCGCASYAESEAPRFPGKWQYLVQSNTALMKRKMDSGKQLELEKIREQKLSKSREEKERYRSHRDKWLENAENRRFKENFDRIAEEKGASAKELDLMQKELADNRTLNLQAGLKQDPEHAQWLEEFYNTLQAKLDSRILELLQIEPSVSIEKRTKAKVAIVEIGESIKTIGYDENNRWRDFFKNAGFEIEPVFLPAFLVGPIISADSIRLAAARAGADLICAYTTTTETEVSPLLESAAVLAYAKCMIIDTRTEFLYLNAEGEGKDMKITLPGMIDRTGFEQKVVESAIESLRAEILLELNRLREKK